MTLRKLRDHMLFVLSAAQKLRTQKSKLINGELEWMIYERNVMLKAVNAARLQQNRLAVTIEEIKRVETCAAGHVDYSQKFALYCAELALQ